MDKCDCAHKSVLVAAIHESSFGLVQHPPHSSDFALQTSSSHVFSWCNIFGQPKKDLWNWRKKAEVWQVGGARLLKKARVKSSYARLRIDQSLLAYHRMLKNGGRVWCVEVWSWMKLKTMLVLICMICDNVNLFAPSVCLFISLRVLLTCFGDCSGECKATQWHPWAQPSSPWALPCSAGDAPSLPSMSGWSDQETRPPKAPDWCLNKLK